MIGPTGRGSKALALALAFAMAGATFGSAAAADRDHGRDEGRARAAHFHRPGEHVRRLPRERLRISVGARHYYYFGGSFYRPFGLGYVVVSAPIGARIRTLPAGYVSFVLGTRHFFYVNSTYYLWEPRAREYVVVEEPQGAAEAMKQSESGSETGSTELFAYPNRGQTADRAKRDRYECHLWAAQQSGYDPTYAGQAAALRGDYRRAMTACLVGRGYTVR